MSIRRNVLIAASAMALAAGPAFAGHPEKGEKKMDPAKAFETMDADSNGSLTMEEVKTHLEEKGKDTSELAEKFAKIDGDEDGEISKEEWDAAHEKKKKEGGEE
ncbi:MAG: EF-hand domain-containing protein [Alphaproteobacteria bacterium]